MLFKRIQGELNPFFIEEDKRLTIVGLKLVVGSYPYFYPSKIFRLSVKEDINCMFTKSRVDSILSSS